MGIASPGSSCVLRYSSWLAWCFGSQSAWRADEGAARMRRQSKVVDILAGGHPLRGSPATVRNENRNGLMVNVPRIMGSYLGCFGKVTLCLGKSCVVPV